jgi:hypothetical protein
MKSVRNIGLFATLSVVVGLVGCDVEGIFGTKNSIEEPPQADTTLYALIREAEAGGFEAGDFAGTAVGTRWTFRCDDFSYQGRVMPYTDVRDTTHYTVEVLSSTDSTIELSYSGVRRRVSKSSWREIVPADPWEEVSRESVTDTTEHRDTVYTVTSSATGSVGDFAFWLPVAPSSFYPIGSLTEVQYLGRRLKHSDTTSGFYGWVFEYVSGIGLVNARRNFTGNGYGIRSNCVLLEYTQTLE